MARSGRSEGNTINGKSRTPSKGGRRTAQRRVRPGDDAGIIPVLARAVREIENAAERGKVSPANRTKFQVIALLMREERARAKSDTEVSDADRAELLKRLDGVATILAKAAARDTSLIALLAEDAPISDAARKLRRDMLMASGAELSPDELIIAAEATAPAPEAEKQVVPRSVISRQLSNPFLAPDFSAVPKAVPQTRRLANWELLDPLFRAFEYGSGGNVASMELPEPTPADRRVPGGLELFHHQAEFVASAREGHRTYLLADEPGLGKTAQALLAASATNSYPLLVVVPNVVKMNWAREVERWTPNRRATVIHGDGDDLDAYADVVIVNYDVLDRHVGWLRTLGFRGMVVDEAHFIKNRESQRSRHVLSLAESIRSLRPRALMIALTGTPLINTIEDFRAIWQFLGWIDGEKPTLELMAKLEETGLTPADFGFFAQARQAVIDMGIVRRKKLDVASNLPSKRIADLPVELDDDLGRGIKEAERELGQRLKNRYLSLVSSRDGSDTPSHELMRMVARAELEESKSSATGENVFSMVRRIGQAKAVLAADYTAQLARSVGKVVFFAKHIDVMDAAEETLARRGLKTVSIRGDQTATQRQAEVDAFNNDPEVSVVVASLTAAGVGLNLQAASNVVLAELSWTSAEQTQAIDRVHRIGQEEPVTAWRVIAAQTIDSKIAELIDSKAGLAARALDGSDEEVVDASEIQVEALVALLRAAIGE
ncbi:DEAD/DEAH box helicase [Salinibacterium sp. dk2585]|uniref:DEAD/DEAH box helicase n=1 Tax=unclassified Salinibacterium TaxID=2632331 RepID=UPI0011C2578C|nr:MULTISPECIES: DEAD/DEAH box helicase [unclassified Salinibacterium]QEE61696.1 DEAD/DEAH box helicase [Salinibacterium sp. dk2585]TXK54752.1 DEAD/DEAH box helicase [Salinibacterium sp. dk5596]